MMFRQLTTKVKFGVGFGSKRMSQSSENIIEKDSSHKFSVASIEILQLTKKSSEKKSQENFFKALDLYNKRDHRKRGVVEFIRAALKQMKAHGLHCDLEAYRALFDLFPKGRYIPENMFQAKFSHCPKQQDCGIDILTEMEFHGVIPDENFGQIILNVFGSHSDPIIKYARMLYWMPKLKNKSKWLLPSPLPEGALLARLALQRITSVDPLTYISTYDSNVLPESIDKTWIVSGVSPSQKRLMGLLPKNEAIFVEGGFSLWLKDSQILYYILRGAPRNSNTTLDSRPSENIDDVTSKFHLWMIGEGGRVNDGIEEIDNVHEQEDGRILSVCVTGTSSRDSLLSWIRFLQKENCELENIPILFSLSSPSGPLVLSNSSDSSLKT